MSNDRFRSHATGLKTEGPPMGVVEGVMCCTPVTAFGLFIVALVAALGGYADWVDKF